MNTINTSSVKDLRFLLANTALKGLVADAYFISQIP